LGRLDLGETAMEKLDFKKRDRVLYTGKVGRWDRVTPPKMALLMIDGQGDPNGPGFARALAMLYPMAYAVKFAQKNRGGDFVVPPLEGLWWSDDTSAFVSGDRSAWKWTAMLRVPDAVKGAEVEAARDRVSAKLAKKPEVDASALADVRFEGFDEGDCLQTLFIGPYSDEPPVLADLHDRVMPEAGLTFNGAHHEIYLGDPRRAAPEKLKTILRQPVRAI
jgi:hypothetical protein